MNWIKTKGLKILVGLLLIALGGLVASYFIVNNEFLLEKLQTYNTRLALINPDTDINNQAEPAGEVKPEKKPKKPAVEEPDADVAPVLAPVEHAAFEGADALSL